jgi:hypothetical protein
MTSTLTSTENTAVRPHALGCVIFPALDSFLWWPIVFYGGQ